METGLYVSLSAQVALQRRLETVAGNVANANTPGFRAEEVSFAALIAGRGDADVAFATAGDNFIARRGGPVTRTGGALDVAVQGDSWLAVETPAGPAYTRDGRLKLGEDGILRSIADQPLLDAGGAPLALDPSGGPLSIARDGMITQGGRQVGALGLFSLDPASRLARGPNATVYPDRPATPQLDFVANGLVQGAVEGSNVNPVLEMAKLIAVTRTFEQVAAAQAASENVYADAIRVLGATT